jgi:hypothetical protein
MFNFLDMAGNYETRKVGRFDKDGLMVSTAQVNDGREPFETAIKHPKYADGGMIIVECYHTRSKAAKGHAVWVERMTSSNLPDELVDCQNSMVSQMCDMKPFKKKD